MKIVVENTETDYLNLIANIQEEIRLLKKQKRIKKKSNISNQKENTSTPSNED